MRLLNGAELILHLRDVVEAINVLCVLGIVHIVGTKLCKGL